MTNSTLIFSLTPGGQAENKKIFCTVCYNKIKIQKFNMPENLPKKRLFIAIPISANLQKEILRFQKQFPRLNVRWLYGKNLHITLIPPWYEENVENLKTTLKKIKESKNKIGSIKLLFEKVAFGPDPRAPRLIWAEGETPQSLIVLKHELDQILLKEKIIQKIENRPFRLHMTLARFRPENFHKFPIKKLNEKISWEEDVTSIVLMESHLSPRGADYEILDETIL